MNDIPLGKEVPAPLTHDPSVLYPVKRQKRDFTIYGFDIWRAYELSWLNAKGKPVVAILECIYPVESQNIIESKSLKLYLEGISNTIFESSNVLQETIRQDLSAVLSTPWLSINLIKQKDFQSISWQTTLKGSCLDTLDIEVATYHRDPSVLHTEDSYANETLYSDLLKSYCPITHQPDWGSVVIEYQGRRISHTSLLQYVISYRNHTGFAEDCCEQIFTDIQTKCHPEHLRISLWYLRRGGIDINPVRSSYPLKPDTVQKWRLLRQ